MTAYDRWVTREPDWYDGPEDADPDAVSLWASCPPPYCVRCGSGLDNPIARDYLCPECATEFWGAAA